MQSELRIGLGRLKLLHQISRADNFLFEAADQFDGAGVDEADIGDVVFRRILHGNDAAAGENFGQSLVHLLPAGIGGLFAGSESSAPCSMRWTSFRGSPRRGMK